MSAADVADARRALVLLDLTDLGDHTTPETTDRLCERAVGQYLPTAAVCLWPQWVRRAAGRLARSPVRIATVVNFPSGDHDVASVVALTATALHDGADEIDLVLPYRAFLAGDVSSARSMVDAIRAEVTSGRLLKVILESGSSPDMAHVHRAARLAIDHGADFVKTSTGKTAVSATDDAVVAILQEIRDSARPVGIKPSGGIRTLADARRHLDHADTVMGPEWAAPTTFRFGASGLLDVLEATIAGAHPAAGVDGY